MKTLDRFVALLLLAFFAGYLYLAFNFYLLPFEKLQSFRSNTMPKSIGIIGIVASFIVLVTAQGEESNDNKGWRNYSWKPLILIVISLIIYPACIKPLGFVIATTSFLVAGSAILGERSWGKMILISVISSIIIWLLVDKVLSIYMNAIPLFLL